MKTRSVCSLFLTLLMFQIVAGAQAQTGSPALEMFHQLDGEWTGVFRIFSLDGRLVQAIQVHQKYFWEGDTQRVVITDKYPDGRTEISRAVNYLDGSVPMCVVHKADGSIVRHAGHVAEGRLFWRHEDLHQSAKEIFKEYVSGRGRDAVYFIDGVGVYGSGKNATILLFEGRYSRPKGK